MPVRLFVVGALLATSFAANPVGSLEPAGTGSAFATASARRPLVGAEPGFWARLVGPDGRVDPVRAWRESARAVATTARPFAQVAAEEEPKPAGQKTVTLTDVGPTGDLDGDGGADVATMRLTYRVSPVWVLDHVDVETRSGRTGRRLWTRRVTLPKPACENAGCGHLQSFGYAFATPVGGAAGIEVVLFGQLADLNLVQDPVTGYPIAVPGSSYLTTFDVMTLDRRGRQKWSRHLEGRVRLVGPAFHIEHLPVVYGASARLEPGSDLDWLYESVDGVVGLPGSSADVLGQRVEVPGVDLTRTQTYTLDGRTGTDRAVGQPRDGAYAAHDLTLVGDLSGDGRDDIVTTPPWSFGEKRSGVVSGRRSTDGTTLWQWTTPPANWLAVEDAKDLTGDGRVDIVVVPVDFESTGPAAFVFVDGRNGKTLWSRSAHTAAVVAGRRPLVAFGIATRSGGKTAVAVSAYDGRNRAVFQRRYAVTGANAKHTEGASLSYFGDLDADGVGDLSVAAFILIRTEIENGTRIQSSFARLGVLSGATGRALPKYDAETYALHESLDGSGDDVETDGPTGARIRDGRTGRTLLVVDLGRPVAWIGIGTQHADRDRCLDVFVVAYFELAAPTVYGIVSGATGRVLWQATDGGRSNARIRASGHSYRCR